MLICFLSLFRKKENIQPVLHLFQGIWWLFSKYVFFLLFHSTVCSLYRRDQEVCKEILNNLLPIAVGLAQFDEHAEEARNAKGQFLTVVGAFWYVI